MRYHVDMQFRCDGEFAGPYRGLIGHIISIDFSSWTVGLLFPGGDQIVTGRQAVTLVNHDACAAPGCTANQERTELEP